MTYFLSPTLIITDPGPRLMQKKVIDSNNDIMLTHNQIFYLILSNKYKNRHINRQFILIFLIWYCCHLLSHRHNYNFIRKTITFTTYLFKLKSNVKYIGSSHYLSQIEDQRTPYRFIGDPITTRTAPSAHSKTDEW